MKKIGYILLSVFYISGFAKEVKPTFNPLFCEDLDIIDIAQRRHGLYYVLVNKDVGSEVQSITKGERKTFKSLDLKYSNIEVDPRRGTLFLLSAEGQVLISPLSKPDAPPKTITLDHQGVYLDTFYSLMNRKLYLLSSDGLVVWAIDPVRLKVEKILSAHSNSALTKLERIFISSDGTDMYWVGTQAATQKLAVGSYKFKKNRWQLTKNIEEVTSSIGFGMYKNQLLLVGPNPKAIQLINIHGNDHVELNFPLEWDFQSYLFVSDHLNAALVSKQGEKSCMSVMPLKAKL